MSGGRETALSLGSKLGLDAAPSTVHPAAYLFEKSVDDPLHVFKFSTLEMPSFMTTESWAPYMRWLVGLDKGNLDEALSHCQGESSIEKARAQFPSSFFRFFSGGRSESNAPIYRVTHDDKSGTTTYRFFAETKNELFGTKEITVIKLQYKGSDYSPESVKLTRLNFAPGDSGLTGKSDRARRTVTYFADQRRIRDERTLVRRVSAGDAYTEEKMNAAYDYSGSDSAPLVQLNWASSDHTVRRYQPGAVRTLFAGKPGMIVDEKTKQAEDLVGETLRTVFPVDTRLAKGLREQAIMDFDHTDNFQPNDYPALTADPKWNSVITHMIHQTTQLSLSRMLSLAEGALERFNTHEGTSTIMDLPSVVSRFFLEDGYCSPDEEVSFRIEKPSHTEQFASVTFNIEKHRPGARKSRKELIIHYGEHNKVTNIELIQEEKVKPEEAKKRKLKWHDTAKRHVIINLVEETPLINDYRTVDYYDNTLWFDGEEGIAFVPGYTGYKVSYVYYKGSWQLLYAHRKSYMFDADKNPVVFINTTAPEVHLGTDPEMTDRREFIAHNEAEIQADSRLFSLVKASPPEPIPSL